MNNLSKYIKNCKKCNSVLQLKLCDCGRCKDKYFCCECGMVQFYIYGTRDDNYKAIYKDLHIRRITAYNNDEDCII